MENVKMEDALNVDVFVNNIGKNAANMKSKTKSECPQCFAQVLDLKQHIKKVHNKKTETAACKPTRFRMTFFNEKVLTMTSKGGLGAAEKHEK